MSLDVVLFACAGARDRRQCADRGGVHGWVDDERLRRSMALSVRPRNRGFNLVTLFLKVVEHFVERLDLRLAIYDALGYLVGDDVLLARQLLQIGPQLPLIPLGGLLCCREMLVDLVLDRCSAFC
ncbi:hypothetical protein [Rhizobium ruizarguesonis]|uniref:hypothetical protein n=1 Tax=Rhizobium ruizarguesonis TaxID=2081791 RepID=UPI001FDEC7BB|nr:hypothetical protein [Rhizobium ruizarguesonis]